MKQKLVLALSFLLFLQIFSFAQLQDRIKWSNEVKDLGNNEYEVIFKAQLDKGWHVYAPDNTLEELIITTVTLEKNTNYDLVGKQKITGKKKVEFSEAYKANISYFEGLVSYVQKIKAKSNKPFSINVAVEHQVCDDQSCLAPDGFEKSVMITPKNASTEEIAAAEKEAQKTENNINDSVTITKTISNSRQDTLANLPRTSNIDKNQLIVPSINIHKPLSQDCTGTTEKNSNLLKVLFWGFLGGLVALMTPCVFPMIPLTVSFFTKGHEKGKGKMNATLFGIFILVIFMSLSIPFYILDGIQSDIFNQISTNIYINIFFFIVFIVFALSFFGYFELTLPSSWLNKSDKASDAGGILGVFFMALTLIIVSFSCTGPILGTVLANAITSPQDLTFALAGFGLSWGFIFGGFAFFPKILSSLPKSGGWMNTIKVLLGFIELGLALKFLSKADLVAKTFLIKRELFIAIWIIIAILIVLYLLKFIKFPHDNPNEKTGWTKRIIAIFFLAFSLYLFPGLYPTPKKQANLTALSGILPPQYVSYFNEGDSCPLGLKCIHDYHEALAIAQKENKPILIDFTGYGCENCRKMEEFVWSQPDVLKILENDVVLASLYVDEKTELPEKEQLKVTLKNGNKRTLKTYGDKWTVFQKENFENNSQPFYVLITPDQRIINLPKGENGYMDKEVFKEFLQCGIAYYKNNISNH